MDTGIHSKQEGKAVTTLPFPTNHGLHIAIDTSDARCQQSIYIIVFETKSNGLRNRKCLAISVVDGILDSIWNCFQK